jgi:hypothetical protein
MQTFNEIDILFDDMIESIGKLQNYYKEGKISDNEMDAFLNVFLKKLQDLVEVTAEAASEKEDDD